MLMFSSLSFADHHALSLEARQPTAELELTSITVGDDFSIINGILFFDFESNSVPWLQYKHYCASKGVLFTNIL